MHFNFATLEKKLLKTIPKGTNSKFPGGKGLKRTKYFLNLLGNPQNKLNVIHIAGTSGKGSTAYLTSLMLHSLGFKTGLHLSPHLIYLRERFQINNALLSKKKTVFYFNQIFPKLGEMKRSVYGMPTYFEVLVALAYYIFHKEKVDYAIVETGLGGTYDGTNVVDKIKLVILTRIGLDHTEVLGKTIKEIAKHKANVISNKSEVITFNQNPAAMEVIKSKVKEKNVKLHYAKKTRSLKLGLLGEFQKENCSLALKAVTLLSARDGFECDYDKINMALESASFPGRFEIITIGNKKIVLDGAHNPQKMSGFIKSLVKIIPDKKFDFLVGFKRRKDYKSMLKYLAPVANRIYVTKIFSKNQDLVHLSESPQTIVEHLTSTGFKNNEIVEHPKKIVTRFLRGNRQVLVITGSLYLISELYIALKILEKR